MQKIRKENNESMKTKKEEERERERFKEEKLRFTMRFRKILRGMG